MKFNIFKENIDDAELLVLKPVEKLSNSEYDELKPYIENMGGHWRERVQGFVFSMKHLKREGYSAWQEQNQFFPTPKAVAERVVELSGIKDLATIDVPRILEPSAGHGALLDAIPNYIFPDEFVVEPNAENAEVLRSKGHMIEETTFEDFCELHKDIKGTIDYVIMNPPFSGSRDVLHTMMAYEFLRDGGTLVAIVSENALYYNNDSSVKFREWLKKHNAYTESVPYGSFKDSGTTVDTVIIKIIK